MSTFCFFNQRLFQVNELGGHNVFGAVEPCFIMFFRKKSVLATKLLSGNGGMVSESLYLSIIIL